MTTNNKLTKATTSSEWAGNAATLARLAEARAEAELARPTHSDADLATLKGDYDALLASAQKRYTTLKGYYNELDATHRALVDRHRHTQAELDSALRQSKQRPTITVEVDRVWGRALAFLPGARALEARPACPNAQALADISGGSPMKLSRKALIAARELGFRIQAVGIAGEPATIDPGSDTWEDLL
jgi:hypothetical protein